jgi:hypothetical protein
MPTQATPTTLKKSPHHILLEVGALSEFQKRSKQLIELLFGENISPFVADVLELFGVVASPQSEADNKQRKRLLGETKSASTHVRCCVLCCVHHIRFARGVVVAPSFPHCLAHGREQITNGPAHCGSDMGLIGHVKQFVCFQSLQTPRIQGLKRENENQKQARDERMTRERAESREQKRTADRAEMLVGCSLSLESSESPQQQVNTGEYSRCEEACVPSLDDSDWMRPLMSASNRFFLPLGISLPGNEEQVRHSCCTTQEGSSRIDAATRTARCQCVILEEQVPDPDDDLF